MVMAVAAAVTAEVHLVAVVHAEEVVQADGDGISNSRWLATVVCSG